MRGGEPEVLRGEARLAIELGGVEVEVGPLGFLQPNPACAALAYAALTEAEPGALAFDLYAGAGITTALLRRRFARVLCCEAYPESARALAVAPLTAARFLSDALAAGGERPGLVVANPPRAGLGEEVCTLLCELARRPGPGRLGLHLMSCEPRSLGRDLGRLTGPAGGFELGSVAAFDTLPHTPHVELVALLTAR
jgi:23S rRNA (uracil1939-C5)-methyltransferase